MKIQDVAKRANVGVGTVSRVLNNNGYVSEKTRVKVEQAIQELQYTPNELARNCAGCGKPVLCIADQ